MLGCLLTSFIGLFVVLQALSYKRIYSFPQLSVLAAVIGATKKHIGTEFVVGGSWLLYTCPTETRFEWKSILLVSKQQYSPTTVYSNRN